MIADHDEYRKSKSLSQNLYTVRGEAALFEQLGSSRPRFPSTKRTATFAYALSRHLSPLSLSLFSRVFPINYICQVGTRNSASVSPCTREPRAAANADLRKIGARFWETVGQQTAREKRERGKGTHLYDETAANAATYPVDVGAGHRKTYNLTDGDRARCAKRVFDLFSRASIITGIFVRTSTLPVEFACN